MRRFTLFTCLLTLSSFLFSQQEQVTSPLHEDLPFTFVNIDESTPEWARKLYGGNPNLREVQFLFHKWRLENPNVKNGHTRNYKHYLAYLVQEDAITSEGYVSLPTDKEERTKAWKKKRKSLRTSNRSQGSVWEVVGPTFVPETQGRVNAQANVYAIDQSQSSPNILYMGTETGVVLKTLDKGENWVSVSDDYTFGGPMEIEIHPNNPDIVYLGTQHDIMKTEDGGETWHSMRYNYNQRMSSIIIDPSNPETVIAGGVEGMYRSTDGGLSWRNITSVRVYDLKFKSDDSDIVFALWNNSSDKVTDFYRSSDNGASWSKVVNGWLEPDNSAGNAGGRMTTSDLHSGVIYTFTGARYTALNNPKNGIKIRKSSDAGLTWTLLVDSDQVFKWSDDTTQTTVINSGQGYYDWDIEMLDADTNTVMLGTQGKWLTVNGFADNKLESWGPPVGGHSDMQEALFNGDDLWVATDGGLVKSHEGLIGYDIKMRGVNCAEFWSFDQGWNRDAQVGSLYHNGTIGSTDTYGTGIFRFFGGAEPEFSALKHPTPDKIISKGYGSVNGRSMPDNFDAPESRFDYNLQPNSNYALWLTNEESEIEVSPYNYNIHWAGEGNRLLKSSDFGFSWKVMFTGRAGGKITKIEIPKSNASVMYVAEFFSSGYTIYKSVNGGESFAQMNNLPTIAGSEDDGVFISCDHTDENILYIGFRDRDNDNDKVWKTEDGGISWTNINAGSNILDGEWMTDILAIAGTDGDVYVTTYHGVFHKSNTSDWVACLEGLPANLRIRHIKPFYKEGKIRIGTMNRGVYSLDMINQPSRIEVQPTVSITEGSCSKDTFYFDDYSTLNHDGASWTWSFQPEPVYISDPLVRNPKVVFPGNGTYQAILTISKDGITTTDSLDQAIDLHSLCQPDRHAGSSYKMEAYGEYAGTEDHGRVMEEWTVSFWVKPSLNKVNTATLFDALDANSSRGFCANYYGSTMNLTMHYAGNSGGSTWGTNPGMPLIPDEWNHVTYTSSVATGDVTLYVNGLPFTYPHVTAQPVSFEKILVGWQQNWWNGRWYEGEMDELAIYNRALSQDEVRLRMHITKDLSNDEGLIHYYQWNEGLLGLTYDKVNTSHLRLRGSTVSSDGPFAAGTSSKMNIGSAGLKHFVSEGVEMTFPIDGTYPNGEVVVTRLDTVPLHLPSEDEASTRYWVIHNFGTNKVFSPLSTLKLEGFGTLSSTEALHAGEFELYQRDFGQGGNTWGGSLKNASSLDAHPQNTITFDLPNVTSFGQYSITKGACISSPKVLNSNDSGPGSLRQALLDACPSDTIRFDIGTNQSLMNMSSLHLDIDKDVCILGNGPENSILSGGNQLRIFRIMDPATRFELQEVSLQNSFSESNGGAFLNNGKLVLENCVLVNNAEATTAKAFTNHGEIFVRGVVEVKE